MLHPRLQNRAVHPQRHCPAALARIALSTLANKIFVAVQNRVGHAKLVTIFDANHMANLHKVATAACFAATVGTLNNPHALLWFDSRVRCR
jgi:hypothetical protein